MGDGLQKIQRERGAQKEIDTGMENVGEMEGTGKKKIRQEKEEGGKT